MRQQTFLILCCAVCAVGATTLSGCGKNESSDSDVDALRTQLREVQATLDEIKRSLGEMSAAQDQLPPETPVAQEKDSQAEVAAIEIRSLAEAKAAIEELGENPSAQDLAFRLSEVDLWIVSPEEVDELQNFKNIVVTTLQKIVADEVAKLQKKALQADSGGEAAKLHAEAGQVLALFPLSEEAGTLDKARSLASKQGDVAVRLQMIRRQRYNRWAAGKIEKAINGYYNNSSTLSPVAENKKLVESCVKDLAEIDPSLLEPAVLDLYSYILDLTNQAIAETDKVALSKGLSDPKVMRKSLGDF